jgi:hypothetical protein
MALAQLGSTLEQDWTTINGLTIIVKQSIIAGTVDSAELTLH